jgi:hypothetical protein
MCVCMHVCVYACMYVVQRMCVACIYPYMCACVCVCSRALARHNQRSCPGDRRCQSGTVTDTQRGASTLHYTILEPTSQRFVGPSGPSGPSPSIPMRYCSTISVQYSCFTLDKSASSYRLLLLYLVPSPDKTHRIEKRQI